MEFGVTREFPVIRLGEIGGGGEEDGSGSGGKFGQYSVASWQRDDPWSL